MGKWIMGVLRAIDRLGNALRGGNDLGTISGATGYFANHHTFKDKKIKLFWETLEKIIDFTFRPIDTKHHCYVASRYEVNHLGVCHQTGAWWSLVLLSIMVIVACLLIIVVTRPILWMRNNEI